MRYSLAAPLVLSVLIESMQIQVIGDYYFNFPFENAVIDYWVTEKPWHAFMAGE